MSSERIILIIIILSSFHHSPPARTHARTLLSSGAPCTPWGGSLWSRFRSRISRRRAAVDICALVFGAAAAM